MFIWLVVFCVHKVWSDKSGSYVGGNLAIKNEELEYPYFPVSAEFIDIKKPFLNAYDEDRFGIDSFQWKFDSKINEKNLETLKKVCRCNCCYSILSFRNVCLDKEGR